MLDRINNNNNNNNSNSNSNSNSKNNNNKENNNKENVHDISAFFPCLLPVDVLQNANLRRT